MSLAMRPPSSEALAYLRRSLAIPLYSPTTLPFTLRSIPRSQHYSPSAVLLLRQPPQSRALHLYKTARATTVLGQHKVLPFALYKIPRPSTSKHKINLLTKAGGELIAKDLTLEEVLENHISPGNMLYLTDTVRKSTSENWTFMKEHNIPQEHNNYAIFRAGESVVKIARHKHRDHPNPMFRDLAGLKEIHVNLASPPSYWMLVLGRAYAFLDNGHQLEFSIRYKGTYKSPSQRSAPGDRDIWPWMHEHFPHLRPDFILKGMPKGAYYMIDPVSNGKHVQFVIAMPHDSKHSGSGHQNLTRRLFKVKKQVKESIEAGLQAQLPKHEREKLIKKGSEDYSLDTGLPRSVADIPVSIAEKNLQGFDSPEPRMIDTSTIRWGRTSFVPLPKAELKARLKKLVKDRSKSGQDSKRHTKINKIYKGPSTALRGSRQSLEEGRDKDLSKPLKRVEGLYKWTDHDKEAAEQRLEIATPSKDRYMESRRALSTKRDGLRRSRDTI